MEGEDGRAELSFEGAGDPFGVFENGRFAADFSVVVADFKGPFPRDPAEEPVVEEGGEFCPDDVLIAKERGQESGDFFQIAGAAEIHEQKSFHNPIEL